MAVGTRLPVFVLLAVAITALFVGYFAPDTFAGVPRVVPDFGVYYACAQVNARGENPYEGTAQAEAQAAISTEFPAMRANSGPWTLAALTPFTVSDYGAARTAWLLVELALLFFAGGTLWSVYGGDPARTSVGWVFAVSGYASLQALVLGQTSPFVLAGLCLAALLAKPQNQLVFYAVLALWVFEGRRWKVVAGALLGGLALTAVAAAGNPRTFSQYFEAMSARPPTDFLPPLPGSVLRLLFGTEKYWLTMVPLIPGAAWGVWYYARHRKTWDWADRLPLVLLVSYLASPYGWAYDQVVFLFPLVQLAAGFSRRPGPGVLFLLAWHFAMSMYYVAVLAHNVPEFHWVWVAPVTAVGYLVLRPLCVEQRGHEAIRVERLQVVE